MADFLDEEAEVETSEDEDDHSVRSSGQEDEDNESPKKKKVKKKKKRVAVSSDEDEEEDGENLDQDLPGLINDEPEEEGEDDESVGSDSEGEGRKRHHSESEGSEVDEEDIALIEENLGIKIDRKQKRRRIKSVSDEEEAAEDHREEDGKEVVEKDIFGSDEENEETRSVVDRSDRPSTHDITDRGAIEDLEQSEESDEDDFIVDDEGKPISKGKKKRHIIHDDVALQEAQDIFGVDFDFEEFEQYGDEEYEEEQSDYEDVEDDEERVRPVKKKKSTKKPITQVYEPAELESAHYTDYDQEIRAADMPERFQLRSIPVSPTEDGELEEEAQWIYKQAFDTPPVSRQEYFNQESRHGYGSRGSKGFSTVKKIQEALGLMRNQKFEIPFIAFYRKEHIDPELTIRDLWTVYRYDEKWMQLRLRKQNLLRLVERMQQYQYEMMSDPDRVLESHVRTLTEDDVDRVRGVQSLEELQDVYQHFLLYYGNDVPKMKAAQKAAKKKQKELQRLENGEEAEQDMEEEPEEPDTSLKQATRKTGYSLCVDAGLVDLARKFGLSAEQFGENLRDNYGRHEVEQDPAEPSEVAEQFIKGQFSTVDDVLKGARYVVAMQLAHDPLVRLCVRQVFRERCKITLQPTKKGIKEIDESHPCFTFKFLKNKPVQDLTEDQFLKIHQAEQDQLLTYELHIDEKDNRRLTTYFNEIKQLFHRDEFSNLVQQWNEQREQALDRALTNMLYPLMSRETKARLLDEAKESIRYACCLKLNDWLKVAPYQIDEQLLDDDDYSASRGLRVMGLAYSVERSEVPFCVVVDGDGEVIDYRRLPHIMKRRNGFNKEEAELKEQEVQKLKDFISTQKPHVIAVGAESRDATLLIEDLKQIVADLDKEQMISLINVELVDNELARVFASSKKAEHDMREYPELLRQAVSLARRLQDPLVEFAQLCNTEDDILALRYHPMQKYVEEDLLEHLTLEFVNRVNEVGVDVNRCITHQHTASLIQFVCGLGPRKGVHLLKTLKQHNLRLENRTQLVTLPHIRMGPKVFINCAGFIKIDTKALADTNTDTYVEPLDSTRIHPETYDWARKMAVDALEYDDTAEDANPAGALEEIIESPDRLKDLDLDAFAEELERQGYGAKKITLYDIRAELTSRYKDLRTAYRSPTVEEYFNLLTKETPETFYIGKLVTCRVTGIAHRRPTKEQLELANPIRSDETQLWQCPFCDKKDFPELSEVWSHFDTGRCVGQSIGVKTRIDNGVTGFIHVRNISDKQVNNPEERVRIGDLIYCRITKIDIEKFQVELTCKSSDLIDADSKWRLQKDQFYDFDTEKEIMKKEEEKKKQPRQTYTKRVIAHPSFKNIDFKATERLMESMDQGDVIIRPSSKGSDHLTCTWKVADGILQHIDIREEGKENAFSLGKSLYIGNEAFEDLDEVIARYVQPMAGHARDLMSFKNYKDADGGRIESLDNLLREDKRKMPSKIPYYLSASRQYPGKFLLSYLPRRSTKHEFITVTPDGLRYRTKPFSGLPTLIRWFKEHFRDPIPGTPVGMKTPGAGLGGTPVNIDAAVLQRAVAGLPSSVFSSLQQVTGQATPYAGAAQFQTPMPPRTPMISQGIPVRTPMHTPMPPRTPMMPSTPRPGPPQWNYGPPSTPQLTQQPLGPSPKTASQWQANASVAPQFSAPQPIPVRTPSQPTRTQVDWGQAAQQWVSRQEAELGGVAARSTPRTPRRTPHGQTPGDATPLIDER